LKDLNEYEELVYSDYGNDNSYECHTEMSEWRNDQNLRLLGTMKTYFKLTVFEHECVLHNFNEIGCVINTKQGRASVDEILLALIYVELWKNMRHDFDDTFVNAMMDYDVNWYRVHFIINEVLKNKMF